MDGDIHVELCIIINNYARFVYGRWLLLAFLSEGSRARVLLKQLSMGSSLALIVRFPRTKLGKILMGTPDVRGRSNRNPSIAHRRAGAIPLRPNGAVLRFSTTFAPFLCFQLCGASSTPVEEHFWPFHFGFWASSSPSIGGALHHLWCVPSKWRKSLL